MTKDKIIIAAIPIILSYCYKNHVSIGGRYYLWRVVVNWGRKVEYLDAEKLAAAIIRNEYSPITFDEIESLQRFYFSAIFD